MLFYVSEFCFLSVWWWLWTWCKWTKFFTTLVIRVSVEMASVSSQTADFSSGIVSGFFWNTLASYLRPPEFSSNSAPQSLAKAFRLAIPSSDNGRLRRILYGNNDNSSRQTFHAVLGETPICCGKHRTLSLGLLIASCTAPAISSVVSSGPVDTVSVCLHKCKNCHKIICRWQQTPSYPSNMRHHLVLHVSAPNGRKNPSVQNDLRKFHRNVFNNKGVIQIQNVIR